MKMKILTFLFFVKLCDSSPVYDPRQNDDNFKQPIGLCPLPKELNYAGEETLMEDCDSLGQYGDKIPTKIISTVGSSIYICCPNHDETRISFYEDEETSEDNSVYLEVPDDSTDRCDSGTTCTDIDQCSEDEFIGSNPPFYCGFSTDSGRDKVCCKTVKPRRIQQVNKKYGLKNYDCHDFNKECQSFVKNDPTVCTDPKHPSYNFMRLGCMKSCNRCGTKGCVDEFQKCQAWMEAGHCVQFSDFMFFNCRESCGACGFRSPSNNEKQVVKGRDFTDIKSSNFFCGEGKAKKDVASQNTVPNDDNSNNGNNNIGNNNNNPNDLELFSYSTADTKIFCGSTIVNDRFLIFAAHCLGEFVSSDSQKQVRSIILRDDTKFEESIEVRRVFVHPTFAHPSLYNDIAIVELGRRIIYDYDIYGDTPACISSGKNILGKTAISQGYGYTENNTVSDVILETNVNIISNSDCDAWLTGNTTNQKNLRSQYTLQLNKGIDETLVCSVGNYNKNTNVWSGPCKGDSGGPLYINFGETPERRIQTLEGIVSGGIGCGRNIPAWYTRVSAFRPWIDCIIDHVNQGLIKEKVERSCYKFVE